MNQSQFSLSWDAHKSNICKGLSSLQQNGEFVDMTLAADGHYVKVHQVIMALASPYIKDLIATAQCPHPVIFLNKISYTTLSAILEYIYTGEVQVSVEYLTELIDAGKSLHIKGLEDMKLNDSLSTFERLQPMYEKNPESSEDHTNVLEGYCYLEVEPKDRQYTLCINDPDTNAETTEVKIRSNADESLEDNCYEAIDMQDDTMEDIQNTSQEQDETTTIVVPKSSTNATLRKNVTDSDVSIMQYTVSTQGSLQMILNRFLYYLKHCKRDGTRHWRCVDYLTNTRCPALVLTKNDIVTERISAHKHTFHDKKILKKLRVGSIFTAIQEAEREGNSKKVSKAPREQIEGL